MISYASHYQYLDPKTDEVQVGVGSQWIINEYKEGDGQDWVVQTVPDDGTRFYLKANGPNKFDVEEGSSPLRRSSWTVIEQLDTLKNPKYYIHIGKYSFGDRLLTPTKLLIRENNHEKQHIQSLPSLFSKTDSTDSQTTTVTTTSAWDGSDCEDIKDKEGKEWKEWRSGRGCESYIEDHYTGFSYCNAFRKTKNEYNDMTANEACCACEGGQPKVTTSSTPTTSNPMSTTTS